MVNRREPPTAGVLATYSIGNRQSSILQRRPELFPDFELVVEAGLLSACELAPRSHLQGFPEDFAAHVFDSLLALQDGSRIDIQVLVALGELGIGTNLHYRSQSAADTGSPASGEQRHLRAA